jgi:hypothetical protein
VVHLGVQRPLGERLLQLVEQAARIERRLRVGAGQELVEDGIGYLRLWLLSGFGVVGRRAPTGATRG